MIKIVPMRQAHYPWVSDIYQKGIDTKIATFTPAVPDYKTFDLNHIKDARWVAMIDSEVIGWAALSPASARHIYRGVGEVSIYIHPLYQNKGVGKQLMQHLITESEKMGFGHLLPESSVKTSKASSFTWIAAFESSEYESVSDKWIPVSGWMSHGWKDVVRRSESESNQRFFRIH
jgi:L-amino acid N-acyltransferase YncA